MIGKTMKPSFPPRMEGWEYQYKRAENLEQQITALVEALEAVEWYYAYDNKDGHPVMLCPKCENRLGLGHKEDCQTKQALALVEGDTDD